MPDSLNMLIAKLDEILADLEAAVTGRDHDIDAVAPEHRRGARNLVRYTALRGQDVRELQNDLMDLGASSLASPEANVRAKVQAARNVLAALRGDPGPWDLTTIDDDLDAGDEILDRNARNLFGPPRAGRHTRIMVTLPSQAADDPALVADLITAGMDVARINCAHDNPDAWRQMIAHVRDASAAAGREVLVSMDVPGPKLRTGPITDGPAVGRARVRRDEAGHLLAKSSLWLVPADLETPPAPAPATSDARPTLTVQVDPAWLGQRRPEDAIRLRDNRGRRRRFIVAALETGGALAYGSRNAYIADGTLLDSDGRTTRAGGIPPVPRRLLLRPGDRLVLTDDLTPVEPPAPGETARIGCTLAEAVAALRTGQPVLLDDGAIEATVESVASGEATLLITRTKPGGQRLGAEKGINLPETHLPLPALTAEDQSLLPFIAAHADAVAVSFLRSVADIDHVLEALDQIPAPGLGLILKIETGPGFRELPSMLLAAMRRARVGVMIARGDLAVEVGFERLSEVPRQILALCEAAHVPAIWATQVLETLAKTGQPSRAEITDAATAQRADCVMLNKGPYIVEAIRALDDILARMGRVQRKSRTLLRPIHSWADQ
ncbi:pyruvate kinase [Krasilnikovia cinnamomea]|uniref:Pyruvate kinase n=2 Tax=Krasilnikovia cinnamomea TaxID=349313 RepID=A0A4Q7ZQ55_9ACTN|nr:pyruvate kinase [Krasilnikovia cinnamomea]